MACHGVFVDAGTYQVELKCEPLSFALGGAVALAGALLLTVVFWRAPAAARA